MNDGDAKIVALFPTADEHDAGMPAEKADHVRFCRHARIRLDEVARRVYCRECDAEVDPFAVILTWANDWARIANWRKEAARRRDLAASRLEEILRLETNARARMRKNFPDVPLPAKPYGEGMPL